MKTDMSGGASANDELEDRLARRFAGELDRAERDYPALRLRTRGAAGDGRSRRVWPRLVAVPVGIAALLLVAIAGSPLLFPGTAPLAPAPGASGPALGSDGIPTQIDGQRVYRVADQAEWQNLSGSFLLGSYVVSYTPPCPPRSPSLPSQDAGLVGTCMDQSFAQVGLMSSAGSDPMADPPLVPAPQGASALDGWIGGSAVVMRVHTHDPQAASCSAEHKSDCESALVVEAVVWPVVPTEIGGEHVYRSSDKASFASLKGSFLLGGPFTRPEFIPTCPVPLGKSAAEQQLIPYCYVRSIDGLQVAPESNIDEPNGEIVVARVHVNDPLAAQCPAEVRADCEAAIVVEAVVWQNVTVQASPISSAAPSSAAPSNSENPASSDSAGPWASSSSGTGVVQLGPDGVPTSIDGQQVYRSSTLPTSQSFLLGGRVTRDASCPAPASPVAKAPACGYWMIDGVKVGAMIDLPESLLGQMVVAQVDRSPMVMLVCPSRKMSCTSIKTIVIAQIVWQTLIPPPPPVVSAS